MKSHNPFTVSLSVVLIVALIAPTAFLIVPQRVFAQDGAFAGAAGGGGIPAIPSCLLGIAAGLGGQLWSFFTEIPVSGGTTSTFANAYTAGASVADCAFKLIIQPILRQLIREFLKALTSSIINWINNTPGTGQPSFVQNLSRHLQRVGDAIALPFINQVRRVLSPQFAAAIASSLMRNYALGSSVGGFLAANQSTLTPALVPGYTPGFLAGDMSQGGIPAWFALTTKNENNPYLLNYAAQDQLRDNLNQAKTNRRQDLVQSGGFLSWCGEGSTSGGGTGGVNPRAQCIDSNGKAVNAKTPGTVIRDYTQQVLGSELAQLINPNDIDQALTAIVGAVINRGINEVFGTNGLFGASQPSSIRPVDFTSQTINSAASTVTGITAANQIISTKTTQISDYNAAWSTISTAANSAGGILTSLKACASQSEVADVKLSQVGEVIAQVLVAAEYVRATENFKAQVEGEVARGASTVNTNAQILSGMPPTTADITDARAQAEQTGTAVADPAGSLSISGGTMWDRLNLISTNAQALSANCPQ